MYLFDRSIVGGLSIGHSLLYKALDFAFQVRRPDLAYTSRIPESKPNMTFSSLIRLPDTLQNLSANLLGHTHVHAHSN